MTLGRTCRSGLGPYLGTYPHHPRLFILQMKEVLDIVSFFDVAMWILMFAILD